MHIHSYTNPNVFKSNPRSRGEAPKAATAIEGSAKQRFRPCRITVAERMAGLHASTSSPTNNKSIYKPISLFFFFSLPFFEVAHLPPNPSPFFSFNAISSNNPHVITTVRSFGRISFGCLADFRSVIWPHFVRSFGRNPAATSVQTPQTYPVPTSSRTQIASKTCHSPAFH